MPGTALIFGARNLGLAIAERLSGSGWSVAMVARSSGTVSRVKERLPDAFAFELDASHPARVADALDQTRERYGALDLLVNAVSPGPRPGSTFGGGSVADSSPDDLDHYAGFVTDFLQRPLHPDKRAALVETLGDAPIHLGQGESDARVRQMLCLLLSTTEYQVH